MFHCSYFCVLKIHKYLKIDIKMTVNGEESYNEG